MYRKSDYIQGVDELIAATPFDRVAAHYGLPPPEPQAREYRMPCVFHEDCQDSQYGQLTVALTDPARLIYCHSCKSRGSLLALLHGLEHHAPPSGGRLRGEEFKAAVRLLRAINQEPEADPAVESQRAGSQSVEPTAVIEGEPSPECPVNLPLRRHEKPAARALEDLYEELIVDPSLMPPKVAGYFRSRPWLTPELARQWGVGYLPRNGRSLFRGYVVYTHRSENGHVLSYSGRDADFEQKWRKWIKDGRPEKSRPAKHRYVSGYHRGLELYGQTAARQKQESVRKSLAEFGLIVVEGANDVLRLDALGAAAVGLCSNRATTEQIQKIVTFARHAANNRVTLLPDCDEEGEDGFRELLWSLNENGLTVQLGWSRAMFAGTFQGRQPEQLSAEEWTGTLLPSLRRNPA